MAKAGFSLDSMDVSSRLREVPISPGVYFFRASGKVVYVGKARSLRDRLRSYFGEGSDYKAKEITKVATDFEFVLTQSEQEALSVEAQMIKHYRPRFNTMLKDDKDFLYLKIPDEGDFPPILVVHSMIKDKARYYGPYLSWREIKNVLYVLKRHLPYRACSDRQLSLGPCPDYRLGRCVGACAGVITPQEYKVRLHQIDLFLSGQTTLLARQIKQEMQSASSVLEFEKAGRLRDQLAIISSISERHVKLARSFRDQDFLALAVGTNEACIQMMTLRARRLTGQEQHLMSLPRGTSASEIISSFITSYYSQVTSYPGQIVVSVRPEDASLLSNWLEEKASRKVEIVSPQKGALSQRILDLVASAQERLRQREVTLEANQEKASQSLEALAQELGLSTTPKRIECYDVSNLQGSNSVAAMTVAINGVMRSDHYRHFKIQSPKDSPDDFESHRQTLRRRLAYLKIDSKDKSFSSIPDLLLIDGGKGQLSAAVGVLEELGLKIPVAALAKEQEEVFLPNRAESIKLSGPPLFLFQRLRDEAHRFAITHHRVLREKESLSSPIDSIEGIGPKRKKELLKRFGTLRAIRAARIEELVEMGIPNKVAKRLHSLV